MTAMNLVTRLSFLLVFSLAASLFAEEVTEEEIQRLDHGKQVPSLSNTNGNFGQAYREAVAALRKNIPAHTQQITVMHHYRNALFALRFEQLPGQYDDLMELLSEKFGDNVLLLASLRLEPHFRFVEPQDGKFLRRNTGRVSALEHDRAFLLKMMLSQTALDAVGKAPKKRQEWFYRNLVRILLAGRENGDWYKLHALTPLTNLPPFAQESRVAAPQKQPEVFASPQSFASAKDDGERLRLALACAVKVDPASPAQKVCADALFNAYGQKDWISSGFAETYDWKDNEIEFSGQKTVLPPEHDFAALYRNCGAWRELAAFYAARGQNEKAVEAYKKAGLQKEADALTQPYVSAIELFTTQPVAELTPQIPLMFRNVKKVHVTVRKADPKRMLADRIEQMIRRPFDFPRTERKDDALTTVAEYDCPLPSVPHHRTAKIQLRLRQLPPGEYHIRFSAGPSVSETVLRMTARVLTSVRSDFGETFFLNDALTGAPLPNQKVQLRLFDVRSKKEPLFGEAVTDSAGCFVPPPDLQKKADIGWTAWLIDAGSEDAPELLSVANTDQLSLQKEEPSLKSAVLTDSPVYHPGETVRFTLYLSSVGTGAVETLPVPDASAFPAELTLWDPDGKKVIIPLKFDAATLSGEYKLPYEALSGVWQINGKESFWVQDFPPSAEPAAEQAPAVSLPSGFSMTPGKDTYAPGETAEIRVRFPKRYDNEPFRYYVTKLDHASRLGNVPVLYTADGFAAEEILRFPVTKADAPNIVLRAFMIRNGKRYESYCSVEVCPTAERTLALNLTLPQSDPVPGSKVKVKVSAKNPVKGTAVTLRVFDRSLAGYASPDSHLARAFQMPHRHFNFFISDSLEMLKPAYNTPSDDAPFRYSALPLKRDFLPSVCCETRLLSPDGTAEFEFTLPDVIAEWQVEAQAVTPDTKTGEVSGVIHAHPETGVSLVLPQQVYRGESFELEAKVKNYTEKPVSLPVHMESDIAEVSGEPQTVKLAPQEETALRFNVRFPNSGKGSLRLSIGGEYQISVLERGTMQTALLQGVCNGEKELILTMPPGTVSGWATILLPADRQNVLTQLLPYLAAQPGSVLMIRKTLGKDFDFLKVSADIPDHTYRYKYRLPFDAQKLEKQIRDARLNLVQIQNADGGWGWYPSGKSNLYSTTRNLETLLVLADFGYPEDLAIKRGTDFLSEAGRMRMKELREKKMEATPFDATLVRILTRAGRRAAVLELELFKRRNELPLSARAELGLSLPPGPERKQLLEELRTELEKKESLSVAENALSLQFFQRTAPKDPLIPRLTKQLMQQVRIEPWKLDHEAIGHAVAALTSQSQIQAGGLSASLNGFPMAEGIFSFRSPASLKLMGQGAYTVLLHGFFAYCPEYGPMTLRRSYRRVSDGENLKAEEAIRKDEVFEVELQLKAPKNTRYVIVRDFLPNGFCYVSNVDCVEQFYPLRIRTDFHSTGPEFRIEALPDGIVVLKYRIRAVQSGTFYAPSAHASAEFQAELRAGSEARLWQVSEK